MEEYIRKYKKLIFTKNIYTGIYLSVMALAFLGGLAGIIVCGINNRDTYIMAYVALCIVVPSAMWIVYLIFLVASKDAKRKALDSELENSGFTADEIMQIGEGAGINLFNVALCKRVKELGLKSAPEWCVRDDVLPTEEDIK